MKPLRGKDESDLGRSCVEPNGAHPVGSENLKQPLDRAAVIEDRHRSVLHVFDSIVGIDADRGINRRGDICRTPAARDRVGRVLVRLTDDLPGANAAALFAMPDIDGGLIGGASLVADEFLAICRAGVI